ncbi:tetratricopeptide repeat protein [Croceitalea rosinachiae]|uniref:Tetratricopeptide repeat protein n=1 Tax=Croceitalea rosinachiae TaxID=3075596 RepID=A0ABU3ABU7_9FLAO|nr:tetratricopeptide repeat protein [Croceitalea sp. F388]MDT0607657.1 tetratricopeptide repeat protein [Croceitalea sp. F388]
MKYVINVMVFFSICFLVPSYAQVEREIDSILKTIPSQKDSLLADAFTKLHYRYRNIGDLETAEKYSDSLGALAYALDNPWLKGDYHHAKGGYYINTSNFQEALKETLLAKDFYTLANDQYWLAQCYNHLGIIYKYLGQTGLALESYLNSLKIKEDLGQTDPKSLMNIGVLYAELDNLEVSNDYYKRVEAICLEEDIPYGLALTRSNLATNLVKMGDYSEALRLYKEGLLFFKENELKNDLGEQYNLMAAAYIALDSLGTAKRYLELALNTNEETGELKEIGHTNRYLGDIDYKLGKYNTALRFFQKSLEIAGESSNTLDAVKDYLKISDTYEKLGNLSKAYEYRKKYYALNDTVFNQKNKQKISALELQFQAEKSQQEIELQNKEIALLEEKQKASRIQRIALIAGLIATVLIFGIGIYALRQKMKRNRLERERVKTELDFKKKELTTHALQLAKKNEVLEGVKQKALELKNGQGDGRSYQDLITTINFDQQGDKVWENFTLYFEAVHKDFEKDALSKYPDITRNELRLMALIKMNLSSKEVANILNISSDGVKKARQRLRKKMQLAPEESLDTTIMAI